MRISDWSSDVCSSDRYKALAEGGRATSRELADRTGLHERYVREWLSAQAAAGYGEYDAEERTFFMSPEQVMALADENSPVYMASAFHLTASVYMDEPKIAEAFRTGEGVGWHEHSTCLFCGVEQFFRTGYQIGRAHV